MDETRAHELLATERAQIERALASLRHDPADSPEPGDRDSEGLYQDEFDQTMESDLEEQLAAVARAEQRLADGTYGLSVDTGTPIPDARLEALPSAERTVEEEERLR
jgi:DnaK suppressor protein